ncbi:MAG: PD-(D/E)XK nuclease family protein, partial [Acidimicrobiia bacterium]
ELEAALRIDGVLDELSGLDAVGSPVDLSRFSRSLTAELDTRLGRVGRFGAGVLVAPLGQAYAGDFDIVYVLGAVEGSLPPRGREDPLLPDRDRRGITALRPHATRRLEERRDYLTALASAPERVLVFPRADGRAQRTRLPAQWVLETAHALGGTDLTAERLRDTTSASWIDVVDSFEGLVTHRAPASTTEYRLRALGEWRDAGHAVADHPLAGGELSRGFVAAHARASSEASAFEGFLGASPSLAPGVARPTSPTALQDWASCPFRYFLARVLRLRDVPRPEETQTISALDEGTLIHDVLEEFLRDSPALTDPETRWTSADRARLTTLVDAKCDEAEARGITGRRVPWILARRRIVRTAARFLATDEYVRHRYGVVPAPDGLERAFGDDGEPPVEVDLGDGRSVRFRGRIDRVDRAPGGKLAVVYDYKTGGSRRYEGSADDPVDAGKALQLPVYALAARAREGTDDAIAAYWFTRFDLDDALLEVSLVEAEERFVDVVGTIVDGAGRGCFPAVPGDRAWNHIVQREVWETCRFCDFDRLCPVDRGTAWGRIRDDEAAAPFRALELPDEVPELDLHAEAGDPA